MRKAIICLGLTLVATTALGAIQTKKSTAEKVNTNRITKILNKKEADKYKTAEHKAKPAQSPKARATASLPEKSNANQGLAKPVAPNRTREVAVVAAGMPSNDAIAPLPGSGITSAKNIVEVPEANKEVALAVAAEISRGGINGRYGSADMTYTLIRPEVMATLRDYQTSTYANMPILFANSDQANPRIIGRPEIGAVKTFYNVDKLTLSGAFGMKLPLADNTAGGNERLQVWEFAPSATGSYYIGYQTFVVGSAGFTYNTNGSVGTPIGNLTVKQAPTFDLAFGAQRDIADKGAIGVAFNQTSALGDSSIGDFKRGGLNASHLSLYGSYAVQPKTKVLAKLTKGLRTDFDLDANSQFIDSPSKAADASITLGVTNSF